jgi:chloramphenicol-sensitive protein RarD
VTHSETRVRAGFFLGLSAFLLWGVLPLYFKMLMHVAPTELVAQRVLWSLLLLAALILWQRRWKHMIAALRKPRLMLILCTTAALIAANWLVYIWAVTTGHVLASSLGYYLNPLANILLGVLLLRERLTKWQSAAVLLAAAGVSVLAFRAGGGLWISVALAGTFSLYGFVRKIAPIEAVEGLSIETMLLAPVSLVFLLWLHGHGGMAFGGDRMTDVLIMASGIVTAVPLLLFNAAAKRLRYSTVGFLQYVAPSIQFVLAISAFREKLSLSYGIAFAAIWTALAILIGEGVRNGRAVARERAAAGL